jgi:transcriptional regulator GlxA family with amidase domain
MLFSDPTFAEGTGMQPQLKRIGMLLFDDCDLLDFSGPTAVFHSAARHLIRIGKADELLYVAEALSIDGGPVRTMQGVVIETRSVSRIDPAALDTLIVTGGVRDHHSCDPRLISWIRNNHEEIPRVASVCCGAFLLAAAGPLNGRPATTHWEDCTHLQAEFPEIEVRPDSIYVQDGKYWTAAGITAGIDMALAMVEEDHGHALTLLVARNLVVYLKRPGGQSQFSAPLQSQSVDGPLGHLLSWIIEHPMADLRAEALAERAGMSVRNLYRAFEAATGNSPAEWVEMARIETAKRRLAQSADKIEQVAYGAGFRSYEQMRKAFARRTGINPSDYRARFASVRLPGNEPAAFTPFFDECPRRSS